jgi:hypothetical protein
LRGALRIVARADAVMWGCPISMFNAARMALADLRLLTILNARTNSNEPQFNLAHLTIFTAQKLIQANTSVQTVGMSSFPYSVDKQSFRHL